jgi:hypothetical protein
LPTVSQAKSAERHILVECETKESCNMLKTIKLDCKGVRKIVTSLPLGVLTVHMLALPSMWCLL